MVTPLKGCLIETRLYMVHEQTSRHLDSTNFCWEMGDMAEMSNNLSCKCSKYPNSLLFRYKVYPRIFKMAGIWCQAHFSESGWRCWLQVLATRWLVIGVMSIISSIIIIFLVKIHI